MPMRRITFVRRVCIIGAGPAGIAAAKALQAENHFSQIEIFEQRGTTGGVWNWEPKNDILEPLQVPSINPDVPLDQPIWRGNGEGQAPTFQSPMYERLEANLPKMLMQHSDMAFPAKTQLFPRHGEILEYLNKYANDVSHMITFETQVEDISMIQAEPPVWRISTKDLRTDNTSTHEFDAVVVASGHYQIPFIPAYEGLEAFARNNPGFVTHSKLYNAPDEFKDKTVLLVGFGPSGSDIAGQIARTCRKPLHVSTRSGPPALLPLEAVHHPAIARFFSSQGNCGVQFVDTGILDVDTVMFCTGYLYSYPCLSWELRAVLDSPLQDNASQRKGSRLHGTYQQIFFTPQPTLSFLTLPWNIVPFPVAESQAAVIARVYAGRLGLPDEAGCWTWEHEREAEEGIGAGKEFHRYATPRDMDYINELYRWCIDAEDMREAKKHNNSLGCLSRRWTGPLKDENKTFGKKPPHWDGRMRWLRVSVPDIKKAFAERGDGRHAVRTLEELGFHYTRGE